MLRDCHRRRRHIERRQPDAPDHPRRPWQPADQPAPVSPGTRRAACHRRRRRHGVPREQHVARGRLPRRRGVLRHLGVPDHPPVDRRARTHRLDRPQELLAPAVPPAPPGAVRDDAPAHRVGGVVRVRGARRTPRRRDRRHRLHLELVPDLDRRGVQRRVGLRTAASPVEPRGRGTVLRHLAAGDALVRAGGEPPDRRDRPLSVPRCRGHHRDGRGAQPRRPPAESRVHPRRLLDGLRSPDLDSRHVVPVDDLSGRRPAPRLGVRDDLATQRRDARPVAHQGSRVRRTRARRVRRPGPDVVVRRVRARPGGRVSSSREACS